VDVRPEGVGAKPSPRVLRTEAEPARLAMQPWEWGSMYERIQAAGGIRPTIPTRAGRHLTLEDREEISRGLAAGHSLRQIAGRLGRAPSTVTREVGANGRRCGYRGAAGKPE
jgi:hypothetical protein